jgi:tetratricopeptide (TPR) repeat protein
MAYPGNPELSAQAQERVMTAFRQAVAKLQDGQREEATISLEFVLRLDPAFAPAVNLKQQLGSGAQEIDLGDIIGQLQAPTTETINELLVEAVEDFNQRNFVEAKEKVEKVLLEIPGHQEARQLLGQVTDALKVESQVGQFLAQAREALAQGDAQEAANFVMMAQALDPHHSGIAPTLAEINERGGLPEPDAAAPTGAETVAFETSDVGADGFSVQFDELAQEAPEPLVEPAQLEGEFVPPGEAEMPAPGEAQPPAGTPWEAGPAEQPAVELPTPPLPSEPQAPGVAEPSEPEAPGIPAGDDLFAESPEPAPQAPPSPEPPPAQEEPPDADDISDLFEADVEPSAPVPTQEGAAEAAGSPEERLMSNGQAAFESGDFLSAIDSWSRIYLIDPSDQAIGTRISEAKSRLEDQERRIEHKLFEAQDAKLSGENDKALSLADEILALQPTQIEALELRQSLAPAGEPPPPPAPGRQAMPDLDAELFDEGQAPAEATAEAATEEAIEFAWEEEERKILGLPLKTVALIGGGVAVVAVLLWLASSLFMGSKQPEMDVYELRAQTEELFRQGKVAAALKMVEEFESSDPADQLVINRLRDKYQQALATPTPTPLPVQLMAAEKLREHGYFFHAYDEVMSGLRSSPEDPALLKLKRLIDEDEPMVSVLHSALANLNFQSAVGISRDLLVKYPNQMDLVEMHERSLFNAALAELRAYNLTGAQAYLTELDERRPSDEVVDRILEFIGKYKARPVDMQLKVFIGSIDPRARRTIEIASSAPEAAPDAAAAEATPTPPPDAAPSEPA